MSSLKVQEPGPKYCHFPRGRGYDENFFAGLLSERLVLSKTGTGSRWRWEKIPGHERNEALDCRNYAIAALEMLNPDWDAIERSRSGREQGAIETEKAEEAARQGRRTSGKGAHRGIPDGHRDQKVEARRGQGAARPGEGGHLGPSSPAP